MHLVAGKCSFPLEKVKVVGPVKRQLKAMEELVLAVVAVDTWPEAAVAAATLAAAAAEEATKLTGAAAAAAAVMFLHWELS